MGIGSILEPDARIRQSGLTWASIGIFFVANAVLVLISEALSTFVFVPRILARNSMHETSAIAFVTALVAAVLTLIAAYASVYNVSGLAAKTSALGLRPVRLHWYLIGLVVTIAFALAFGAVSPAGSLANIIERIQIATGSLNNDKLYFIGAILIPLLVYEVVVRGIVLQALFRHLPNVLALLLASLFGLSQIPTTFLGFPTPAVIVLLLALSQLVLSYIAAKSGSILPTVLRRHC